MFRTREVYEPEDMLVVIKDDGTADIAAIVSINDERIYAESTDGSFAVPIADAKSHTGRKGRIFLYPSTVENVTDCQRIAALERSTVLRQITHFDNGYDEPGKPLPLGKIMFVAAAVILLIIFMAVM